MDLTGKHIVKEAHMMYLESILDMRLRCIKIEEVKESN